MGLGSRSYVLLLMMVFLMTSCFGEDEEVEGALDGSPSSEEAAEVEGGEELSESDIEGGDDYDSSGDNYSADDGYGSDGDYSANESDGADEGNAYQGEQGNIDEEINNASSENFNENPVQYETNPLEEAGNTSNAVIPAEEVQLLENALPEKSSNSASEINFWDQENNLRSYNLQFSNWLSGHSDGQFMIRLRRVNVHAGPSYDDEVVEVLKKGATVHIQQKEGVWYKLGDRQYIHRYGLKSLKQRDERGSTTFDGRNQDQTIKGWD